MKTILAAGAVTLAMVSGALAGPEGTYSVTGTNPGGSGTYRGIVTVSRTGETYKVIWDIAGTRFTGSGLGAAPVKGGAVMGPAASGDDTLAVGYISGPQLRSGVLRGAAGRKLERHLDLWWLRPDRNRNVGTAII